MTFLSPLLLALMGAAAVPLLLHLMRRRIGARVDFPAVRYLRRAEQEHSRQLKLRNLLLMVLRVVIVLLVALAAARPVGPGLGSGHPPTAIAIVLDNSLSTTAIVDGRPVLERLRAAAIALVRSAQAADRLWLVTADATAVSGSASQLVDAIARVEPLAGGGALRDAVQRGAALVRAAGLDGRHLAVVTDGQATAWRTAADAGGVTVTVLAPELDPSRNRAVTRAVANPVHWTPRGRVTAQLAGGDSLAWRVLLGGRTLARGVGGTREEISVSAAPAERGWVAGRVELEPDELRGDDGRGFAAWIGDAPRVTVEREAGLFAAGATEALVMARRATHGDGIAVTPADLLRACPALILAPRDPVRLGAANRALERAGVPWRFGEPRRGTARAHGEGGRLDAVRVERRYPLLAAGVPAPAETLATVAGDPWIVAGNGYVVIGSPLDTLDTDFPLTAVFAPWFATVMTERLSGDAGGVIESTPGAPVRLPPGATGLEREDGTVLPLPAGRATAPTRTGVWFVRRGAARVGALVVNVEPDESDLARLSLESLAARVATGDVRAYADPSPWVRASWAAGSRRPLAVPLLLVALLALAAESVVARRGLARAVA